MSHTKNLAKFTNLIRLTSTFLLTCSFITTAVSAQDIDTNTDADTPPYALTPLVVVAAKTQRPLYTVANQVSIISRDRLESEQVQELGEITRYEPALEADFSGPRFGTTGISIRGIGGNRVALEVDGVPLPQRFAVGNFADSSRTVIDPEVIQRIEVLRGPASVLYGSDAIGGVAVITTVDAQDLVAPGQQSYYGFNAAWYGVNDSTLAHATYAYADDRHGLVLAGGRRDGDEIDNQARDSASDLVDFDQHQGFAKWTYHLTPDATLRTSVDYYARETDSDTRSILGFERFANTSEILGDDRQQRSRITLNYAHNQLLFLDEFSATVYRQSGDTEQITREQRTSRGQPVALQREFFFRDQAWGGELKGRYDFTTGTLDHIVVAGMEWDHSRLTQSRNGTSTNLNSGTVTPAIIGETFPLRDFPITRTDQIGLYLQDEVNWGHWTFIPGLRWDTFDLDARADSLLPADSQATDLNRDNLTARFGATWHGWRGITLYAHYSEGFRAPPAEDVNLTLDIPLFGIRAVANPDLEPERSRNFEGGFRWRHNGTSLAAAGYHSRYKDFIESRVFIGADNDGTLLFQSRNLSRTVIYGVEAQLTQDLGAWSEALNNWYLNAGMHWAHGQNKVNNQPLNSISPLNSVFGLSWQPRHDFQSHLRVRHIGRQDRVDFSDEAFFVPPSATVVDVTAQWDPKPWMQWNLGLYNLFGERYWRYDDVRGFDAGDPRVDVLTRPGRHVNVGLRLAF